MKKLILSLFLIFPFTLLGSGDITFTNEELKGAGEKIFLNETGGRRENLIHWNDREEFASLGIGHFIWYPSDYDGPFDESFPKLMQYYRKKGINLPILFEENISCPWNNKGEFLDEKSNMKVQQAITFLDNTKEIQTAFIYERLQGALEGMLKVTDKKENVRKQFYRVAHSPGGLYPLIDYVNFKGEGTKVSERYNNKGWGLLQILENMKGDTPGRGALTEFTKEAKFVLTRRVENAPKGREEERWLPGWNKRIDTYIN